MEVVNAGGCQTLHKDSRFLFWNAQVFNNVSQPRVDVFCLVAGTGSLVINLLGEVLKKILYGLLLLKAHGMNFVQA